MPPVYALSNVDPVAMAICKGPANRKRFFLMKSSEDADLLTPGRDVWELSDLLRQRHQDWDGQKAMARAKEMLGVSDEWEPTKDRTMLGDLPGGQHALMKSADADGGWSVAYAVVAEPGNMELPGCGDPSDGYDVWANSDEIRRAAHRLLKNKAYVDHQHGGTSLDGCEIVESAVALGDFSVEAPDGTTQTIKKDSWYVAIEFSDEYKAKVDSGEIDGVSLHGLGDRTLLQKSTQEEPAEGRTVLQKVAAALGLEEMLRKPDTLATGDDPQEDSDMALTDEDRTKLAEDLKKAVGEGQEATVAAINGLADVNKKLLDHLTKEPPESKKKDDDGDPPSAQEIKKSVDDLVESLDQRDTKVNQELAKMYSAIEALGEGDSTQHDKDKQDLKKSDPLAGILD